MRKNLLFLSFCFLFICSASADNGRKIYRDYSGRVVATTQQLGNITIYKDASGRTIGTERQVGNARVGSAAAVYKDASGKTTGTARQVGSTTVYKDASGRTTGTSITNRTLPPAQMMEKR